MKLLFAIKALHDISGGAERVLADVTGALAARGHDITVLTYDIEGERPFYPLHEKVKLINLALGNPKRKARVLETLKRMSALRAIVRKEKPDIVIGFMHSMFVPASVALLGSGVPLIASEHIVPAHYRGKPLQSFLLLASSIFVSRFTVLSQRVRNSYPAFMHDKMVPIPNPVTLPDHVRVAAQSSRPRRLLLSIGRLDPQKDFSTLIAAFGQIADKFPAWDLRIAGEGHLRAVLEKEIETLRLQDRIFLPGRTQDVSIHYKEADIFVLSSLYESFGLACAEALSYGVPAIAFSDCPGLNELIRHQENGLLIDPGKSREQSLAAGLETLMGDETLQQSLSLRAPATIEHFSLESVTQQWENLFEDVIGH